MKRSPEVDMILLAAFASTPLYLSQAVSPLIVAAFHFALAACARANSRLPRACGCAGSNSIAR